MTPQPTAKETLEITLSDGVTVIDMSKDGRNLNSLTIPHTTELTEISGHSDKAIFEPQGVFDQSLGCNVLLDDETDQLFDEVRKTLTWKHWVGGKAAGRAFTTGTVWLKSVELIETDNLLHITIEAPGNSVVTAGTGG